MKRNQQNLANAPNLTNRLYPTKKNTSPFPIVTKISMRKHPYKKKRRFLLLIKNINKIQYKCREQNRDKFAFP